MAPGIDYLNLRFQCLLSIVRGWGSTPATGGVRQRMLWAFVHIDGSGLSSPPPNANL